MKISEAIHFLAEVLKESGDVEVRVIDLEGQRADIPAVYTAATPARAFDGEKVIGVIFL